MTLAGYPRRIAPKVVWPLRQAEGPKRHPATAAIPVAKTGVDFAKTGVDLFRFVTPGSALLGARTRRAKEIAAAS
jgi:hypothetical protein